MILQFKKRFREEQFDPSFLGAFMNPFYITRKNLILNLRKLSLSLTGKLLDVGCGKKPYRDLFGKCEYLGLEIDTLENRSNKEADYFYDGSVFPFEKDAFDCVLTNQVFEHVFEPQLFLSEINRVLKNDGLLLLTVPFCWDEHEQPVDYGRYTSFGLKYVLEKNGFQVLEYSKSSVGTDAIFQLICAYIYKLFEGRGRFAFGMMLILTAPFNILSAILKLKFLQSEDFFLDNVILVKKVSDV